MWQNGVYLLNGNGEFSDKYSTMPTASIGLVGKIVQYTGTTTVNYTNGYFYKGIATNMPSVATIGIGESTGITEASIVKATFEGLITASGTYDFVFSASTATSDIGTSTGITASSVVVATFETLLTATGDYVFTFDGSDWKYDGSAVTLADYGISVTGTPSENDTVTVSYVKADWKYDGDIVTLSDYGITAVGTPDDQDTISVVYAVAYVVYSWSQIDVQPSVSDTQALLSVTTAPGGSFAIGSKYYKLSETSIYTAVTADTWTGATTSAPQFGIVYTFSGDTYVWDGNSLEKSDLNLLEKVANKSDSYTASSSTTYASTKALVDGLTKTQLKLFLVPSTITPVAGTATVVLEDSKVIYDVTPVASTTLVFDVSGLTIPANNYIAFNLTLNMSAGVQTMTFPASVQWGNVTPTLTSAVKYMFSFFSPDGGTTWIGNQSASWIVGA